MAISPLSSQVSPLPNSFSLTSQRKRKASDLLSPQRPQGNKQIKSEVLEKLKSIMETRGAHKESQLAALRYKLSQRAPYISYSTTKNSKMTLFKTLVESWKEQARTLPKTDTERALLSDWVDIVDCFYDDDNQEFLGIFDKEQRCQAIAAFKIFSRNTKPYKVKIEALATAPSNLPFEKNLAVRKKKAGTAAVVAICMEAFCRRAPFIEVDALPRSIGFYQGLGFSFDPDDAATVEEEFDSEGHRNLISMPLDTPSFYELLGNNMGLVRQANPPPFIKFLESYRKDPHYIEAIEALAKSWDDDLSDDSTE